jgi:TP901 family phage tail tape measure protein
MANRTVWELFLKDSVSRGLNALNGASDKVSSSFGNVQDKISKTQHALAGAANEIPGVSRGVDMLNNSSVLLGAGLMAIGAGLYKATELAYGYDLGMAKINATAQLSEQSLGGLKSRLKDIGSHSGGNFEFIPTAYEKILSQTGKVNLSLDILETAVAGSKAGFTDIDTVAGALAQTLSVVGKQSTTAKDVMDTLLMAKGVGAGEFKDFAQYLPSLISAGNSLHVEYKDVAGLFSYMTAKGKGAADSAMLIQNAFTALQKNDVIKGLEGKGVKLFNADGMRRNIADVFNDLGSKLNGLTDRKKTQFLIDIGLNDAQARTAFNDLTTDGEKFKGIMNSVNHAMGETNRQLAATANSARTWGDTLDEVKNWGESIGTYILPAIDSMVQGLSFTGQMTKDLFTTGRIHDIDEMAAFQKTTNQAMARNAAAKMTQDSLGINPMDKNAKHTRESSDLYVLRYDQIMKGFSDQKNHIVSDSKSVIDKAFGGETINGKAILGKDSKLQSTIDGVSSGGKSVRNVNITIHKLVEQLIIKAGTVTESSTELENKIKEYLLRAIQGSEIVLSNG